MIETIIKFSIKNKFIIGLLMVAWIVAGIWSMREVPIDATPDITNNQVQVITLSSNLGTTDIEQFVTYPVELAMGNLPGVEEIRSISRFGLSVVTIVFEEDMGTYLPRQLVSEKLGEVKEEIPEGFGTPEMGPITTGLGEIYQYTLEVDPKYKNKYDETELRTIQDWIVKRQMSMLPGVVEVNTFGGKEKQYEVAVDPYKLQSMGITITEIADALMANNENVGGAYIEKERKANFIRGEGLMLTKDDIANTVVKNENGRPVLVKDVGTVKFGSGVRYGSFTANGDEAVGGMVLMLKGANSDKVIKRVKERIAEIQKSLPEGVTIKPFLDRSQLIAKTTSTVKTNLIEGGLIVIFILVILLGNWRGGLVVATTIPLSLLFAFILMNVFGVWANLMSLGAIDFGIIVDGAVIIVESAVFYMTGFLHRNKEMNAEDRDRLTIEASSKMMNAAFFGQLIILIVFLPILTLTGIEGKMFRPMALTFSFAMIGAMILCLTYVPMITALFVNVQPKEKQKKSIGDKIMGLFHRVYEPSLTWALDHGKIVVGASLGLLVAGGFFFTRLGGEFIPKIDEGDIAMQALLKPGSALSETTKASEKIEDILLKEFPDEIKSVMARIGVSEIPTDPMPMDIADMFIILNSKDEWTKAKTKNELIDQMKVKLGVLPGINFQFSQPMELRFNELMTGVRQDLAIMIFGEDLGVLSHKAEEVGKLIAGVPGVGDVQVEATEGLPQMTVKYNRMKLARYGLNIADINRVISAGYGGEKAGVIFEGEKKFDMVVRFKENAKKDIESLRNLFVSLPNGKQIPLKEVAQIDYIPAPMQISRDNTKRKIAVGVNVRGRDVETLVAEIESILDEQLNLPPGYSIKYGGSFENLKKAKDRLSIVVPIALGLIFVLLYFALKSAVQSLVIYIAIPLAAIGGIFSLLVRDMPFSISAGVGFIVLFGVAVLNGLVLITSLNELKEAGVENLRERIKKATHSRLRPIVLTASTDILGFLPMAIASGAGAEVQKPLATVVIGGLFTATLLTLYVLPILYQWLESRKGNHSGIKKPAIACLMILGASQLLNPYDVQAQNEPQAYTLEEALEVAKENFPAMKKALLVVEQSEAMRKTAFDLGQTDIFTGREEVGDEPVTTKVGFGQTIDFPTSFTAKSRLLKSQVKLQEDVLEMTENDLVRNVKTSYYSVLYAQSRFYLINKVNEIYKDFERVARIRFETEETTKLEYISASNKYQQVKVAKVQAEVDVNIAKQQLALWLNTTDEIEVTGELEQNLASLPENLALTEVINNPTLKMLDQQVQINDAQRKVESNEMAPKINLQYALQETPNSSNVYSYQVGVSVPLWFKPQLGRIQSAKIQKDISQRAYEEQKIRLESQFVQLLQEFDKVERSLEYYQSTALNLAEEQIDASAKSYKEGEIDYVAYIQNVEEALRIKQDYLSFLNQSNQLIAQINYQLGNR